MNISVSPGGACYVCPAQTGLDTGCAVQCPDCVNALDNYLAACKGNYTSLNYGVLTTLADVLPDPPGFPTGADWCVCSARAGSCVTRLTLPLSPAMITSL